MLKDFIEQRDRLLSNISISKSNKQLAAILVQFKKGMYAENNNPHILLTGKTGSGKTFTIGRLLKNLELPHLIIDSTELTEAGYEGKGVIEVVKEINELNNRSKNQRVVIVFDEFDKLSFKENEKKDISCGAVQYSLLKLMDGHEYSFKPNELCTKSRYSSNTKNYIQTNNTLVIGCGNFGVVGKQELDHEDIIEKGFYPELLGRFRHIITLNDEINENLENVFFELQAIKRCKSFFNSNRVIFEIDSSILEKIKHHKYLNRFGYRGIDILIENALSDFLGNGLDRKCKSLRLGFIDGEFKIIKQQ